MQHADHIKPGLLYGYRTKGDYGDFSDGQGNMYSRPAMTPITLSLA